MDKPFDQENIDLGPPGSEEEAINRETLRAQQERAALGDGPVTVDGEVKPIVVDMGTTHVQEQPENRLALAIAEHFGVEPEALTGFVATVEFRTEEGVTLSSVWSLGVPVWRLRAFAHELLRHLDRSEAS